MSKQAEAAAKVTPLDHAAKVAETVIADSTANPAPLRSYGIRSHDDPS